MFDWIIGFTRPSCNFLNVVNSIPALIDKLYLQKATTKRLDLVQSIHSAIHPDIFAHSNILLVRMHPGDPKCVAMEQISCSVSSTVLGIDLPKCTNCSENTFVSAAVPSNQAHIWCVKCGLGGQSTLPPKLVYPNIKGSVCSVLPYPLPGSLHDELQIKWPKMMKNKREKVEDIMADNAAESGLICEKVG